MFEVKLDGLDQLLKNFDTFGKQIEELQQSMPQELVNWQRDDMHRKYPNLKVLFGHLGEGLPFLQWRINFAFARDQIGSGGFRDIFSEHYYITTSGFWSDPALLLCDELSLGLAPIVVKEIYAHIRKIVAEGVSAIVVEQDIQQALKIADHVYCMLEGRVALSGPAASLTRDAPCSMPSVRGPR